MSGYEQPSSAKFTNRDLQRCAERELALRRAVYAKRGWTQTRAREIAMMEAIAKHFSKLVDNAEES